MKAINIIIILLLSLNFLSIKATFPICHSFSHWNLDIKNEYNTDLPIVLTPGVFTRVYLILSNEKYSNFWDKISLERANITISLNSNYIKLYPQEINLIPTESIEYFAYIGLSCNDTIEETDITLEFDIRDIKDLDGNDMDCVTLNINSAKIEISDKFTYIFIQPIETTLTSRGFSLFKIDYEIYNVDKITIKPENYNEDKFQFENIEIKPFIDRKKLGKDENDNHGILFEYKYGTLDKNPGNRGEINENFKLVIEDANLKRKCFLFGKTDYVNLIINEKNSSTLNESVKEAILYSIENITPEVDKTNNIQIKMDIPVVPIIIKCDFQGDGKDEEKDIIQYNDYISNSGEYIMKVNNLII
jgi:hypothetical protein